MKRLFLFRHAKAVQTNKDTTVDADRPLTDSGRQDAQNVGRRMREKRYEPDLILCSPSVRTRQTLEAANAELRSPSDVKYVDRIYNASARELLVLAGTLEDATMRPMLVGHNPGFEEVAGLLVNSAGARLFAAAGPGDRFPTAGLVVLDFDVAHWSEIVPHQGALVDFIKPKELASG